jgi:microcin C transport system substrate-binding protein
MKEILLCFLLISLLSVISCCEQEETAQESQIAIPNEAELMEKYGPKDLTEEQVDSIIKSIKWETNEKPNILGSKEAKKGGTFVYGDAGYPATLRTEGENSHYVINSMLQMLIYETLLTLDPVTLEYVPYLADNWSISTDKETFFYHIDPKAHWQDGEPVTAFDIVATYDLLIDEGMRDPFGSDFWSSKYERPVALTPDIVMVKAKILQWSLFLYFSQAFFILPEHIIGKINVSEYMDEYNNKMMIGSGPYIFESATTNQSIVLKRDTNWWATNLKRNQGLYNFDRFKYIFYTDETLIEENFKKGEVDAFLIHSTKLKKWVSDFTPEKMNSVKYNHIIKQKIYNDSPKGTSGYHFNMREEPFNDIRVRKAFCLLLDRSTMIEKLFFGEAKHMDSYYSNLPYENKNNPKIRYNPEEAIKLLEEAGYSQKNLNEDGYIVKNGKVFELTLNVYLIDDTRVETLYQEELKKAGIKLNLKNVTWASHTKDIANRNFKIARMGYTGLLFPNPENAYHSKYADKKNNNNIWGLKNKRVDEICEANNLEFDLQKRIKLIQELDSILINEYLAALFWYQDNIKILYWNKFGMPDFVLARYESYYYLEYQIVTYWWYDEEADKKLKNAIENDLTLPAKPAEVREWEKLK